MYHVPNATFRDIAVARLKMQSTAIVWDKLLLIVMLFDEI